MRFRHLSSRELASLMTLTVPGSMDLPVWRLSVRPYFRGGSGATSTNNVYCGIFAVVEGDCMELEDQGGKTHAAR